MLVSWLESNARSRRLVLGEGLVGAACLMFECGVIVGTSMLTGTVWHKLAYSETGDVAGFAGVGGITALLYSLTYVFQSGYRLETLMGRQRQLSHMLSTWTYAFFCLAALAFLTRSTGGVSRGWLGLFYVIGAFGVMTSSRVIESVTRRLVANEFISPRRLMVVGARSDVVGYVQRAATRDVGIKIINTSFLPDSDEQAGDAAEHGRLTNLSIAEAVTRARSLEASEVLILANGTETQAELSSIADQFLDLPVGVHVAKLPLTDKFPNVSVSHIGSTRTLALRSAPMSSFQLAMKRLVDVAISAAALIVLAPVFLVIAAIIKLDSRGPVFFMQSRRGFNQSEFSIWKFRTMTTLDNGDRIEQAKPNDPRITRVGAILRRFNLDELPQLMNVLVGDMSLVGPRPHAVAHDRYYEGIIRRYRRRLNVKPGITGWAQVNGFRGLTNSPHDMRSRIAHDLYYIDHWSITFDLYIMAMTVLSPRAFKNAN